MMKGYTQCPAFKWLHENGDREARFEMQTVVMTNQVAVYEAILKVQDRWNRNEFGAYLPSEAASSQQVQLPEAAEANVQVNQDSQMALG